MKEQYLRIYQNQDKEALIPFLKSLTPKQKKEVLVILEECTGIFNHERCYNGIVDFIYTATFLVCCSQKQFSTLIQLYSLNLPELDKILEWYCPEWFGKFFNKEAEKGWCYLNYTILVDWTVKGFIQPTQNLLANTLARAFCRPDRRKDGDAFSIDDLDKYPITLDEHIWLLFTHTTWLDVSNNDSRFNIADKKDSLCSQAFIHYTNNGRIDRLRVLKECLLTVNNNFKKDLLGEFTELYKRLEPQPEEIQKIQPELFNAFSSANTVMVETALRSLEQIIPDEDFSADEFLASIPLVLTSKTKKIVITALSLLEQLAKNKENKREAVCLALLPVFLNKDEAIQKKAAAILLQWGDKGSKSIKGNLSSYFPSVLQSVQTQLRPFIQEEKTLSVKEENLTKQQEVSPICESNQIKQIETFDDFIFFLSQLFKSEDIHPVEYLPTYLRKFDKQIIPETLPLLEVVFKEVFARINQQCIWVGWDKPRFSWDARLFKHIAAIYLMEYGTVLINRFPGQTGFIKKYREEAEAAHYSQCTSLEEWLGGKYTSYKPLHTIMLHNKRLFTEKMNLPVLSLPTHFPAWIDPAVLIERLKVYQEAKQEIDRIDIELALSRCFIEKNGEFIKQAGSVLDEHYLAPVKEWFDKTMPAISNYVGDINWKISDEKVQSQDYNDRYTLEMTIPDNPWENTNSIFSAIGTDKVLKNSIEINDLPAFMWFYPNNPDVVCARILKEHFTFSQMQNAETRDYILATIQTLADFKGEFNEMTRLFLAACLLCSEKNIRDFAVGVWIEKTASGLLDNEQFGTIMGQMLSKEWSICKRLSDAILNNFLHIDSLHNKETEKLLVFVLSNIQAPVVNLKKLLESYQEVISLNNSKADTHTIPQLLVWKEEKNLKSVLKNLLK